MSALLAAHKYVYLNPLFLSADPKDPKDPAALKVHAVPVENVVLQDHVAHAVHAAHKVHAVHVANVVLLAPVVHAGQEVHVVNAEVLENVALWVNQEMLDLRVHKDLLEFLALTELQVSRVHKVLSVRLVQ